MKKIVASLVISVSALAAGCASIVSDSSYPVSISSSPDGAEFFIENQAHQKIHTGTTPSTITLKSGNGYFKKARYTITFVKEGYQDKSLELSSTMDGWYLGNIIFGGLLGILIVDPATGAMWKLPESQSTSLSETVTNAGKDEPTLKIIAVNDASEEMRKQMVRIN